MQKQNWNRGGTTGQGTYIGLAITSRGWLGVRVLSGNADTLTGIAMARIRLEPTEDPNTVAMMQELIPPGNGWKVPGQNGQHRFSTVVENGKSKGKKVRRTLVKSLAALGCGEDAKVEINPDAPAWAKNLIENF
jgi:hypothetical protein